MAPLTYLIIISTFGNFALAIWVLMQRGKSSSARNAFVLFSFITGLWSFSNFVLVVAPSFLAIYTSYAFGTLVAGSAVLWVLLFSRKKITRLTVFSISIISLIFVCVSFIPKGMITEVVKENGYVYYLKDNFFFPIWSVFVVLAVLIIWWALWSSMRSARGIFREQLRLILFGAIGFGGGALITDVIFPFVGLNYLTILDGTVSLFFTFPAAYAMVRYRFMDIKFAFRKGTVYAVTITIALGVYGYLVFIISQTTSNVFKIGGDITSIAIIILIALGFHPLRKMVEHTLNEYIFPRRVELRAAAKRITLQLSSSITEIEKVIKTIRNEAKPALNTESIDLFFQKELGIWDAVQPASNTKISVDPKDPHFQRLFQKPDIIIAEELEYQINDAADPDEIKSLREIRKILLSNGAAAVVPIIQHPDTLIGILFLGPKTNQSAYTVEDIQFLKNLQQNLPLSMGGIILYYQAMKRVHDQIKK